MKERYLKITYTVSTNGIGKTILSDGEKSYTATDRFKSSYIATGANKKFIIILKHDIDENIPVPNMFVLVGLGIWVGFRAFIRICKEAFGVGE